MNPKRKKVSLLFHSFFSESNTNTEQKIKEGHYDEPTAPKEGDIWIDTDGNAPAYAY